jgi:hypothetical protein
LVILDAPGVTDTDETAEPMGAATVTVEDWVAVV